jgi:acyl carrier protein
LAAENTGPANTMWPPASAPRPVYDGDAEQRLAQIFGQLLGLDEVAAQANFFELGGDSLIAIQLAAAVRAAFGTPITTRQIFTAPTPRRLAQLVESTRPDQ